MSIFIWTLCSKGQIPRKRIHIQDWQHMSVLSVY